MNRKEKEQAFRRLITTKPRSKPTRDEVPKPDAKNTIHTRYRILPK